MDKKEIGIKGETKVANYLKLRLYKILQRNYNTRYGEIDIIASNGNYLCFVEVRTRTDYRYESPAETVDKYKQSRIIKSAYSYLKRNPTELMPRFDVAEVFHNNGKFKINYIKNAFMVDNENYYSGN